ncbi:hypothetical protein V8E55_007619, partial [Tylopilus felleus]
QVKRFDTSSGSLISTWSVPGGGWPASVVLSRNQKFAVVVAFGTLSLWDTSTQQQIGTAIKHASTVRSIALSPNDDWVATGEDNGKVTLRSLRDILPASCLTVNSNIYSSLSLTIYSSITEEIVHPSSPCHHSRALAHRAV